MQQRHQCAVRARSQHRSHDHHAEGNGGRVQRVHGGRSAKEQNCSSHRIHRTTNGAPSHDRCGGSAQGDNRGVGLLRRHHQHHAHVYQSNARSYGKAAAQPLPHWNQHAGRGRNRHQCPWLECLPAGQSNEVGKTAAQPEPTSWVVRRHIDVTHVLELHRISHTGEIFSAEALVNRHTVQI